MRTTRTRTEDAPIAAAREHDLALLTDAVREAGAVAMRYFRHSPKRRRKPDGTDVSEADLAVDAHLKSALTGARPDYGWLSEETPDDPARLERDRVWIVDPIDGTRAFLDEQPEWTIAAALVENGLPVLAAVYNPAREEFFHAVGGGGAQLNGRPLHATDRAAIQGASLIVSRGFLRRKDWHAPWPPVRVQWVNSVAYRLALVSAGRFDATVSLTSKSEWDLAAAHLLVHEAGGRVTTHMGGAIRYNRASPVQASVVAAGPALHAAIVARTRRLII